MNMRRLITIAEAKKQAAPVAPSGPTPEALRAMALDTHQKCATASYVWRTASKDWAQQLVTVLRKMRSDHDKAEKSELEYDESYQPRPFDAAQAVPEALNVWWQGEEPRLGLLDAVRYHYRRYQKDHPNTESSDAMEQIQNEVKLSTTIYSVGLGDAAALMKAMRAMQDFAEETAMARDASYGVCTSETETLMTNVPSLVLTYAKILAGR